MQDAVGFGGASAYAAAELVHLGEAETFGVLDDHDGGVGDVYAYFNDRGGDEDRGCRPAGNGAWLLPCRRRVHAAVEEVELEVVRGVRGGVLHTWSVAERSLGLGKRFVAFLDFPFFDFLGWNHSSGGDSDEWGTESLWVPVSWSSGAKSSSGWSSLVPSITG